MKKLTKTQKINLKKKLLRMANIIGLVIGGLSFLVVLYAIIAGSINSNNSTDTTMEVLEEVAPKPNLEQRALTPPTSYDLELSPQLVGLKYYFYWSDETHDFEALFEENTGTIDYFTNYIQWRNLTITTNVYAPTTEMEVRNNDYWAMSDDTIGSEASSPAFQRFRIELDNRNNERAFLYYGDFSSSGVNVVSEVYLYDNDNISLGRINDLTSFTSIALRGYYVPPYSRTVIVLQTTTSPRYLDALYIKDIGSIAYDEVYDDGFEDGYYEGENDGYADGYDVGRDEGYEYGFDDGYYDGEYEGWANGYNIGIIDGNVEGYADGHANGFIAGYDDGHADGYDEGYIDGVEAETNASDGLENAFDLIYAGAKSVDTILSINIFGSITLGMLLFTPLIIGISLAVVKIIKG